MRLRSPASGPSGRTATTHQLGGARAAHAQHRLLDRRISELVGDAGPLQLSTACPRRRSRVRTTRTVAVRRTRASAAAVKVWPRSERAKMLTGTVRQEAG